MGGKWKNPASRFLKLLLLMFVFRIQGCLTLNEEGLALLKFRVRVKTHPYGVFDSWNPDDCDPCNWIGVHCADGRVHMLDLSGQSVQGILAPEIGALPQLKSLA